MEVLPRALIQKKVEDINICDYNTYKLVSRNKIILEQNVISFLIEGFKEVNFSDTSVCIDASKALLMLHGNCLMKEEALNKQNYRSILLFFSKEKLQDFLIKFGFTEISLVNPKKIIQYSVIEKDDFIESFVASIKSLLRIDHPSEILNAKLEEILLYLCHKNGKQFSNFLANSIQQRQELSFRATVEANKFTDLSLEEIAFLCNMSISTFKRHFFEVYAETPGKWFTTQKLNRAKDILLRGEATPSQLHRSLGYENLSNFTNAFKREFGVAPSVISN